MKKLEHDLIFHDDEVFMNDKGGKTIEFEMKEDDNDQEHY